MKRISRQLLLIAALLLPVTFFTPIWNISISAPQYPEGLGLEIWINRVAGLNPNDLGTINGLNHYIGMKRIEPDDIPELKYMPYIIIFFSISALLIALKGNSKTVALWLVLFSITGAVGLYDFYQWEYDYGHNLNPNAPIKVPGMNYQPPLLGSKQLLNINATSLPGIGTVAILISVILAFSALILELKYTRIRNKLNNSLAICLFLLTSFFAGCSREPVPIDYGKDLCGECEMLISDARFGAERVTAKGKIFRFDSIECLVASIKSEKEFNPSENDLWVTAFNNPSLLIDAKKTLYVIDESIRSPMGGNIAAFTDTVALRRFVPNQNATALSWSQLIIQFNE
ncbi:MAG: nitrous oxide reductase accessory protein NosL [Ignavibacteriales bacterium]|nr:nitrous oxide reductase accessory protein NosL [Ignavibacteriales bacterium]